MKKWIEYRFKIEGYTPDTLPMARCASYLVELSNILGETDFVHFVKVAPGSVQLVNRIEIEAEPRVREHTRALAKGKGTENQIRARQQVNKMLKEDNKTGVLLRGKSNIILFPGKIEEEIEEVMDSTSVHQRGEINGEIIQIGGSDEIISNILLKVEGKIIRRCHTKRSIAKDLGKYLFETVRLFGEGLWNRNEEGKWNLENFVVDRFEALEEKSLSDTFIALRKFKGEWGKDSLYEILESRHNQEEIN